MLDNQAEKSKPKRRARSIKYLTEAEVHAFFQVVKAPRDVALFRLAYHRGLRASEIGGFQLSDFRSDAGRLRVPRLKGSNTFEYRLNPIELKALRAYLRARGNRPGALFLSRNGRGISRFRLHELMRRYCAATGIPVEKAHMHAWKHSCGTHLAARRADVLDIKDHLGHRNIQNTMVYVEIMSERRDEFADKLKDWK